MARKVQTKKSSEALKVETATLKGGQLSPTQLTELETSLKAPINVGDTPALLRRQALQAELPAAKAIEQKRKPLRLRGRRSTIRAKATPDIFASSLGAPKALLGA